MIVTIDLNVILDFFLQRGDYISEGIVLSLCDDKKIYGVLPSHGIPTLYYLIRKAQGQKKALEVVDNLLENIHILPIDKTMLLDARNLNFDDFEDAIVAVSAKESGSKFIITSNEKDYLASSIPAISAKNFLLISRV